MKNKVSSASLLILFATLLGALPGCSTQQVPHGIKGDDSLMTETAFVNDVKALPPDKRWDYVRGHTDTLEQLKNDPDKSKIEELTRLLPANGG